MNIRMIRIAYCAIVAAAIMLLYYPYLNLFIAWDDILWLSWSRIDHCSDILSFFARTSGEHNYRPLTTSVFFALGQAVWGMNPLFLRLCNISVLIANAIMVFYLFDKLTRNKSAAFIASFLYGTHFSHGLVIHLSHIQGLGSTFFFLVTFLLFIKAKELKSRSFWIFSFVTFICALLSREEAVVLPLVFLAYEFIFSDETNRMRRIASAVRSTTPYMVILITYLIWRFAILAVALPATGGYKPVFNVNIIMVKYATYLWWSLYGPQWPVAIILMFIIAMALIELARRMPPVDDHQAARVVLFCAVLFIVYLLPVSPIKYTARHFLSTPLIGIAGIEGVAIACVIRALGAKMRYVLAFILIGGIYYASFRELRDDASGGDLGDFIKAAYYNRDIVRQAHAQLPSLPYGARVHIIGVPAKYQGEFENIPGLIMLIYGDRSMKIDFVNKEEEGKLRDGGLILSLKE